MPTQLPVIRTRTLMKMTTRGTKGMIMARRRPTRGLNPTQVVSGSGYKTGPRRYQAGRRDTYHQQSLHPWQRMRQPIKKARRTQMIAIAAILSPGEIANGADCSFKSARSPSEARQRGSLPRRKLSRLLIGAPAQAVLYRYHHLQRPRER